MWNCSRVNTVLYNSLSYLQERLQLLRRNRREVCVPVHARLQQPKDVGRLPAASTSAPALCADSCKAAPQRVDVRCRTHRTRRPCQLHSLPPSACHTGRQNSNTRSSSCVHGSIRAFILLIQARRHTTRLTECKNTAKADEPVASSSKGGEPHQFRGSVRPRSPALRLEDDERPFWLEGC